MTQATTAKKINIAERRALALEFRKQGMSYRKIGEKLKVDTMTAYRDVQQELKQLSDLNQESAEDLRQLSLERLDMAIAGAMPFVQSGSANHISAYGGIIEKQAKIAGILKTSEVTININIEVVQRFEQVAKELGLDPAQALEEYIQALHAQSTGDKKGSK